ncbi:hypothetical protein [Streptomyces sp. NPDC047725]|uniref:hypothetical protein n=1 Tax=Streptomyces sp. NPDC047725 TaxID=3365487 RepID=UPI0037177637
MHERVSGSRAIRHGFSERTSHLAGVLRRLGRQRATVFVAVVLYNASPELIGEKLGVPPRTVRLTFDTTASRLRHPIYRAELEPLADEIGAFGASALVDEEMRALIREWRLEEMFEPLCAVCARPMPVPVVHTLQSRPGRPRRYCSNACRQKAYRARRKR